MRIVVVGPGAIGCLFGVRLALAGNDVALLDRDAGRAGRLTASGLRLVDEEGEHRVGVAVDTRAARLGPAEMVLVCVKAYDTDRAILAAMRLVRRKTTVVSLQNGLTNAVRIAAQTGGVRLVCAVTAQGARLTAEGAVEDTGRGPTRCGPFVPGRMARPEQVADMLAQAGMAAEAIDDAPGLIWSKLVVNAAVNPVTALHGVPNGGLLEKPDLLAAAGRAAEEAAQVARAKGVRLHFDDARAEVASVCRRTAANASSMLQDIRRGRRTEIDAINGAVVREAETCNLNTPVNADLVRRVKALEAGR